MSEIPTTITTVVPTVAVPPATVTKASSGIEAILGDSWKDFLNKNLKWLTGIVIRYVPFVVVGIVAMIFLFNSFAPASCKSTGNQYIIIKQGKVVNVTKVGKDNSQEDQKNIQALIDELKGGSK